MKNRIIAISVKDTNNTPLSQEDIDITIIHELIHAILFEGGYEHSDEELIELLSTNIYNTMHQLNLK